MANLHRLVNPIPPNCSDESMPRLHQQAVCKLVQDKMHVLQAHLASNKEAALRVASLLARFMQIADVAGTSARRLPASWNPGNSVVWH